MRLAVLALLLVGCVDEPAPQLYTCTMVYRCTGAEQLNAAIALPCAVDHEDAQEQATVLGIEAAAERCPGGSWVSVRPLCDEYRPATSCEPEGYPGVTE